MAQEFFINSQTLEDQIRKLLPSQGGAGAGFDLSASTQIIPIIDLTESAEGSNVRQDIQSALSHASITSFNVGNATTTLISNTGYFRVFGSMGQATADTCNFSLSDGTTDKIVLNSGIASAFSNVGAVPVMLYDFIVFLSAGDSLKAISSSTAIRLAGCTRQIADIDGTLVNP